MKYFIHTESDVLIQENSTNIEFVSFAVIAGDGRIFHAEIGTDGHGRRGPMSFEIHGSRNEIRKAFQDFLHGDNMPVFYGYDANYCWTCICWLFGGSENLPFGFNQYCRDLHQMLDESDNGVHASNADCNDPLSWALWCKELYNHLTDTSRNQITVNPHVPDNISVTVRVTQHADKTTYG